MSVRNNSTQQFIDVGLLGSDVDADIQELKVKTNWIVTPQMFGAVGDGTTDDTAAFQAALNSGYDVFVPTSKREIYVINDSITLNTATTKRLFGVGGARGGSEAVGGYIKFNPLTTDTPLFINNVQMFSIDGLSFIGGEGMEGTFMRCDTGEADVDFEMHNCLVRTFRLVFDHYGRGLTVTNNGIANVRYLANLYWNDEDETLSTHPAKYGHRGIRFCNNRFHMINSGAITFKSGHGNGFQFIGNLMDVGRGQLINSAEELWNADISNNTFMGYIGSSAVFSNLSGGIKNTIISGNIFTAPSDYWTSGTPTMTTYFRLGNITNCVISDNIFDSNYGNGAFDFRGDIDGLNIIGNKFCNMYGSVFLFYSTINTIHGIQIIGNDFKRTGEGHYYVMNNPSPSGHALTLTDSVVKYNSYTNYTLLKTGGLTITESSLETSS